MLEFKSFPKIPRLANLDVRITQKLNGTNGLIAIDLSSPLEPEIKPGSRNRWIESDKDDNFGFRRWVLDNQNDLINFLGEGYHYGEWCGPGIQNGEGLKERGFYLFSPKKRYFNDKRKVEFTPPNVHFVPELYNGKWDVTQYSWLRKLQMSGSRLVPGFPAEGLILEVNGKLTIKVIINEDDKRDRKQSEK